MRVLPGHVQAKSASKAGQKANNGGSGVASKSKERKNRVTQQPYIAHSKIPQAYIQGKLVNMNPAFIAAAMDNNGSQQTAIDLKKAGQLTSFTN